MRRLDRVCGSKPTPACQCNKGHCCKFYSTGLCLQDLPRTFPLNAWVASAEGQAALRRVLLAFSVHKPDVGYCQSMNYVAAMLLLCLDLSEERAFWLMVALIDDNGQYSALHFSASGCQSTTAVAASWKMGPLLHPHQFMLQPCEKNGCCTLDHCSHSPVKTQ